MKGGFLNCQLCEQVNSGHGHFDCSKYTIQPNVSNLCAYFFYHYCAIKICFPQFWLILQVYFLLFSLAQPTAPLGSFQFLLCAEYIIRIRAIGELFSLAYTEIPYKTFGGKLRELCNKYFECFCIQAQILSSALRQKFGTCTHDN